MKIFFTKNLFIHLIFLFILLLPQTGFSQTTGGVIGNSLVYECSTNGRPGECTFDDLVAATRNVVNKLTIYAIGFSVIVIAFAGFKYLTSEGNPGAIADANRMFRSVAIGIAFIVGAWAIVNLIATGLGVTSFRFTP